MESIDTAVETARVVPRREGRRFVCVWLIPVIWLVMMGLSLVYRGGEHMTLLVTLLPAILIHQVTGLLDGLGNNFTLPIIVGFVVMLCAGFMIDRARVSLKAFWISFAAGILLSYCIVLFSFVMEADRLDSLARAANKFDFNQPDRRIAWQILCTALGLYISLPVALVASAVTALRRRNANQEAQ